MLTHKSSVTFERSKSINSLHSLLKIYFLPEIFKISKVTPIFKSGSISELGNYRPIAVISPFSKVLERLVYDQLMSYLEKECLLYNFQFGFRKGYSTEYAILETVEKLKSAVDDQKVTCGIFLDFSKAFDTINHHILLEKLYKYGIRGQKNIGILFKLRYYVPMSTLKQLYYTLSYIPI